MINPWDSKLEIAIQEKDLETLLDMVGRPYPHNLETKKSFTRLTGVYLHRTKKESIRRILKFTGKTSIDVAILNEKKRLAFEAENKIISDKVDIEKAENELVCVDGDKVVSSKVFIDTAIKRGYVHLKQFHVYYYLQCAAHRGNREGYRLSKKQRQYAKIVLTTLS